ncbi:MAG: PPC domain-containing protein, partial [Polyangiaceae bacterium]|nr:PPC domain-containing protein [Polyangiaceae bacterium]
DALEIKVELAVGYLEDQEALPELPDGMSAVSKIVGVLPQNQRLYEDATLTLPFDGTDPKNVVVLRAVPGGSWQAVETEDVDDGMVTALISRLGYFVVVVSESTSPENGNGGSAGQSSSRTGGGGSGNSPSHAAGAPSGQAGSGAKARAGAGAGGTSAAAAGAGGTSEAAAGSAGTGDVVDPDCEADGAAAEQEPNDSYETATRLTSGQAATGVIGKVGDRDWYYLSVCGESVVEVEMPSAGAMGIDPLIDLLDADGAPTGKILAQAYDDPGSDGVLAMKLSYYVAQAGRFYARVRDRNDDELDTETEYTITMTTSADPDEDSEPNGNAGAAIIQRIATPLESGETVSGHIASLEDEDCYAVEADGEAILTVHLELDTPSDVDPAFSVLDTTAGTIIDHQYDSNGMDGADLESAYYLPESGTYFVCVYDSNNEDWDPKAAYALTVTVSPVPDAAIEPNEAALVGTEATLGTPITGYIASHQDSDWFEFEVDQAGTLVVSLVSSGPTSVDFGVALYDEDSARLDDDVVNGSSAATEITLSDAVTPGTYRVRVYDSDGNEWDLDVSYELTVDLE